VERTTAAKSRLTIPNCNTARTRRWAHSVPAIISLLFAAFVQRQGRISQKSAHYRMDYIVWQKSWLLRILASRRCSMPRVPPLLPRRWKLQRCVYGGVSGFGVSAFVCRVCIYIYIYIFFWWVLQHCLGFARLVWGRLRVHRAFIYSDWFWCECLCLPRVLEYMYVYIYMYTWIFYVYTYVYICVHAYIYSSMYTCMYM